MENSSLKYNKELLKLVAENPNHELMFLVSEDCCEFLWNVCDISNIRVATMALYNDEEWLDECDYEEKLCDVLSDKYENDEELKEVVDCKMAMIEFKDYICVYLS